MGNRRGDWGEGSPFLYMYFHLHCNLSSRHSFVPCPRFECQEHADCESDGYHSYRNASKYFVFVDAFLQLNAEQCCIRKEQV